MIYEVITWPEVQELMSLDGFREHSYLVNDDKGIEDFGSSAYFVDIDWLESLTEMKTTFNMTVYKDINMTEERYQYLNSLSLEEYDKETSENEQRAFCEYQQKFHPDEVEYCQVFNPD